MSTAIDTPSSPYSGARPGGRSARVRSAVLGAALDLLGESGYDALSLPAVARRAGVHPTTIYRRWCSKQGLLADAMLAYAEQHLPTPDTGSLRGDIEQSIRDVIDVLSQKPVRELLSALAADAALAAERARFWSERASRAAPIIERAVARGELQVGLDPHDLMESVAAAVYLRALVTGRELDEAFIQRHAERIVAAYAPS